MIYPICFSKLEAYAYAISSNIKSAEREIWSAIRLIWHLFSYDNNTYHVWLIKLPTPISNLSTRTSNLPLTTSSSTTPPPTHMVYSIASLIPSPIQDETSPILPFHSTCRKPHENKITLIIFQLKGNRLKALVSAPAISKSYTPCETVDYTIRARYHASANHHESLKNINARCAMELRMSMKWCSSAK